MRTKACVFLVLTSAASASAQRPVSVEDLMGLRSFADVRTSPDGTRVAYVLSRPSFEKDEHEATLYVVGTDGGAPTRLTYGTRIFNRPRPAPQLRFSPGGDRLSFLGFANELPQVMALELAGGDARALTSSPQGVSVYEWSPDGKRVAYLAPEPPSADEERRRKERSFVIEVDRQDRPARIWIQELAGGAPRALTPLGHFVAAFDWSPDGATIAYAAAERAGFQAQFHTRIYSVGVAGGEPRVLVARDGMNAQPRFSPDGRHVAFVSSDGRPEMVSTWGLHTVALDGLATRNLTPDMWVGEFAWAPDSRSLVAIPHDSPEQRGARMFEQPLLRVWLDGRRDEMLAGPRVNYSPSWSRDGRRLVFRSVEPLGMGDVHVLDLPSRRVTRLTDANPELRELLLGDLKPIRWTSFDGMEIWGLLLTPPGEAPQRPLPLVVYVHGGPMGGFTYGVFPQFMHALPQVDPYPIQAMASAGFAVLLPMPRGGSGYGEAGFRMIKNAWGEGDYRDILAGVDSLVTQGVADPARLGVMGSSYGGYMTLWTITQTNRFKAASAMCSISDIADLYYLSDAGDVTQEYFGLPWSAPDGYRKHSPLTHAARVTTPLLIQHGENDRRTPIAGAIKFYKTLKEQGKTVELEIYPRGGHVLYEPDLQREIMRRNLEWFRRWLVPTPPALP
jgi:dipeptidyl aminopeptidase/acylaminoacyl peptidase